MNLSEIKSKFCEFVKENEDSCNFADSEGSELSLDQNGRSNYNPDLIFRAENEGVVAFTLAVCNIIDDVEAKVLEKFMHRFLKFIGNDYWDGYVGDRILRDNGADYDIEKTIRFVNPCEKKKKYLLAVVDAENDKVLPFAKIANNKDRDTLLKFVDDYSENENSLSDCEIDDIVSSWMWYGNAYWFKERLCFVCKGIDELN